MKFNLDFLTHKAKEAGVVAGMGAVMVGSPDVKGAEKPVNDKQNIPVEKHAEVKQDVTKDAKTAVFGDQKGNEAKEKEFNLEFAKEAVEHAGKGGFVSEKFPGCVLVAESREANKVGSLSYDSAIGIKVYKVTTDNMNGYKIINIAFDGKSINENSDVHVDSRINETRPIGLSYTYQMLREKMNPQDIKKLLETANPGINVDLLIAALEKSKIDSSNQTEIMEINKDITMLNTTSSSESPKLADLR